MSTPILVQPLERRVYQGHVADVMVPLVVFDFVRIRCVDVAVGVVVFADVTGTFGTRFVYTSDQQRRAR